MLISVSITTVFLTFFLAILFILPIDIGLKLKATLKSMRLSISGPMMHIAKFALAVLLTSQISIVLLRYIFGVSFGWLTDLGTFAFAAIPFFGIATTLTSNEHVRLDILYGNLSKRNKDAINLLGVSLFLIPVCCFITIAFWPSFTRSWVNFESFTTVGGLPGKYIFKTMIPIMTLSLLLHGVEIGLSSACSLRKEINDSD